MAKKNSTKTATKEALQSAEPHFSTFRGWQGINIKESPLGWQAEQADERNDSNLKPNYLVVQNNVDTTSSLSLETRRDEILLANAPTGEQFSGVTCLTDRFLFAATKSGKIFYREIDQGLSAPWTRLTVTPVAGTSATPQWSCIGRHQRSIVCLTEGAEIFEGEFDEVTKKIGPISNAIEIPNTNVPPTLTARGTLKIGTEIAKPEDPVGRVVVTYVYTNRFGTNIPDPDGAGHSQTYYYNQPAVAWNSGAYLNISGKFPQNKKAKEWGITGVDVYCSLNENSDMIYAGHVNVSKEDDGWSFNWLGSLMDSTQWSHVSVTVPTKNTTKGVDARYFRVHDGRLYFWGGTLPYRLYIGGNPGNELSVARGTGGAYVDIEPGNGTEIKGTAKFKTYNGASIVTIMCANANSGRVKRYNLLETNLTISNELATKGYMTEEVPNVVGCTSHYGFGVWADGLYAVNRYGLMVTTMAMETNNQLRATSVSDAIAPVFTEGLATRLDNCHMIYIDGIIYIVMGDDKTEGLDNVIICYDVDQKAFYTYTYLTKNVLIHSIFNVDYRDFHEGIGIVTDSKITMIPTTGEQAPTKPETFEVLIETGELMNQQPSQQYTYVSQLEFHFDYIIGKLNFVVEGIDYYGRHRTIEKEVELTQMQRSYPVWMRIDELFRTYKVTIKGPARFRLTHIIPKTYSESRRIDQVYGFVDHSWYANRDGGVTNVHHALESYNNLREVILP